MTPTARLDVTTAFLYAALRAAWDPQALPAARALAQEGAIDWPAWLRTAGEGGVAPHLYAALRGQGVLPSAAEEYLRQAYYASVAWNLPLLQELASILRALAAAGVPTILLKGAALAHTLYENVALRPLADLDLLVRPADLPAALSALRAIGCVQDALELRPGFTETFGHHAVLRTPGPRPTTLELHWTLLPPPYPCEPGALDWFWQTARPVAVDGASALVLAPEALLLHLCGHLLQHGEIDSPRLVWLHDVAGVLFRYGDGIDWDALLAHALQLELVLPLRRTLQRAAEQWHAPVPESARARLRALAPAPTETRRTARLLGHYHTSAAVFLSRLDILPGWRRKFAFALGVLFPRPGYMRERYRIRYPFLLPFAYPYRWLTALRRRPLRPATSGQR